MSGSRREYNEYYESKFDLAIGEAYDKLPDECKHCSQLDMFNSCKLQKYRVDEFDSDCPLQFLLCKNCQYYCNIVEQDGTIYDYGYCTEKATDLWAQENACDCFVEYKKEGNNG